jgi:hypothetical protein
MQAEAVRGGNENQLLQMPMPAEFRRNTGGENSRTKSACRR